MLLLRGGNKKETTKEEPTSKPAEEPQKEKPQKESTALTVLPKLQHALIPISEAQDKTPRKKWWEGTKELEFFKDVFSKIWSEKNPLGGTIKWKPTKALSPIVRPEKKRIPTIGKEVPHGRAITEIPEDDVSQERMDKLNKRTREMADMKNTAKLQLKIPPVIILGETPSSEQQTTPSEKTFINKLRDLFKWVTGDMSEAAKMMRASVEERAKESAERMRIFGPPNNRNDEYLGMNARYNYVKSLWRDKEIYKNSNMLQDLRLSEGINVDTSKIAPILQRYIEKNMFSAQTGGGFFKNVFGAATLYLGQPSIEKTRAQIDAFNQILSEARQKILGVVNSIAGQKSTLEAMRKQGDVQFGKNGEYLRGTPEARLLFDSLENNESLLKSYLADVAKIDDIIAHSHGNINKVFKLISFSAPEFQNMNQTIQNINAGLDKNGKVLKFQKRTAEILNYTLQLMSRSIGQMWKNWMAQLNPITQIKKLFQDFMSYNVKWKRTMNVIKYNIRAISKSIMNDIAQQLVNIIGFFDIISMKIQAAFGKKPISLFDRSAADAERMTEALEEASNVTAGFDELHDISGEIGAGSADMNFFGDIYTPQLSEKWKELAKEIGDLFAGIITGDLGFGDVMVKILDIAWKGLVALGDSIWKFIKSTVWPMIKDAWLDILAWILAAFIAWKGLKVIGSLLWDALFGGFTKASIGGLFSNIGAWILKTLGTTAFGSGMIEGFARLFVGDGLISILGRLFTGQATVAAFGGWGQLLGTIFSQAFVGILGLTIAGVAIAKGSDTMRKNAAYNMGIDDAGGDSKDKKSNLGAGIGTTIGTTIGGAVTGFALGKFFGVPGALIGAGIGAVAGILTAVLSPAIEKVTANIKEANNELLKTEQYEGRVQGFSSQVTVFDEQLNLLKQSLDLSTQSIYNQGEKLGISKTRIDELVKSTQDGTFNTDMLTSSELELGASLTDLASKQKHVTEVSGRLEEAQKKLLKAQTDLSIAQDIAAGNFEVAAARIEVAEAQAVYSTKEATAKRIALFKETSKEERLNLLQNLTPEQRTRMIEYTGVTETETKKLNKIWKELGVAEETALLDGIGEETQNTYKQNLENLKTETNSFATFIQKVWDKIKEIWNKLFGNNSKTTVTIDSSGGKTEMSSKKTASFAVGTNYVPNTGLAYLHQGEAVIPAKYNRPYEPTTGYSDEQIAELINAVNSMNQTVQQGITINGQFVQRGSDLVATVERANSKISNSILNKKQYAR